MLSIRYDTISNSLCDEEEDDDDDYDDCDDENSDEILSSSITFSMHSFFLAIFSLFLNLIVKLNVLVAIRLLKEVRLWIKF